MANNQAERSIDLSATVLRQHGPLPIRNLRIDGPRWRGGGRRLTDIFSVGQFADAARSKLAEAVAERYPFLKGPAVKEISKSLALANRLEANERAIHTTIRLVWYGPALRRVRTPLLRKLSRWVWSNYSKPDSVVSEWKEMTKAMTQYVMAGDNSALISTRWSIPVIMRPKSWTLWWSFLDRIQEGRSSREDLRRFALLKQRRHFASGSAEKIRSALLKHEETLCRSRDPETDGRVLNEYATAVAELIDSDLLTSVRQNEAWYAMHSSLGPSSCLGYTRAMGGRYQWYREVVVPWLDTNVSFDCWLGASVKLVHGGRAYRLTGTIRASPNDNVHLPITLSFRKDTIVSRKARRGESDGTTYWVRLVSGKLIQLYHQDRSGWLAPVYCDLSQEQVIEIHYSGCHMGPLKWKDLLMDSVHVTARGLAGGLGPSRASLIYSFVSLMEAFEADEGTREPFIICRSVVPEPGNKARVVTKGDPRSQTVQQPIGHLMRSVLGLISNLSDGLLGANQSWKISKELDRLRKEGRLEGQYVSSSDLSEATDAKRLDISRIGYAIFDRKILSILEDRKIISPEYREMVKRYAGTSRDIYNEVGGVLTDFVGRTTRGSLMGEPLTKGLLTIDMWACCKMAEKRSGLETLAWASLGDDRIAVGPLEVHNQFNSSIEDIGLIRSPGDVISPPDIQIGEYTEDLICLKAPSGEDQSKSVLIDAPKSRTLVHVVKGNDRTCVSNPYWGRASFNGNRIAYLDRNEREAYRLRTALLLHEGLRGYYPAEPSILLPKNLGGANSAGLTRFSELEKYGGRYMMQVYLSYTDRTERDEAFRAIYNAGRLTRVRGIDLVHIQELVPITIDRWLANRDSEEPNHTEEESDLITTSELDMDLDWSRLDEALEASPIGELVEEANRPHDRFYLKAISLRRINQLLRGMFTLKGLNSLAASKYLRRFRLISRRSLEKELKETIAAGILMNDAGSDLINRFERSFEVDVNHAKRMRLEAISRLRKPTAEGIRLYQELSSAPDARLPKSLLRTGEYYYMSPTVDYLLRLSRDFLVTTEG